MTYSKKSEHLRLFCGEGQNLMPFAGMDQKPSDSY